MFLKVFHQSKSVWGTRIILLSYDEVLWMKPHILVPCFQTDWDSQEEAQQLRNKKGDKIELSTKGGNILTTIHDENVDALFIKQIISKYII